jgi:hypothetical protein
MPLFSRFYVFGSDAFIAYERDKNVVICNQEAMITSSVASIIRRTMRTYEKPIEISRRPWQRRIEVCSPKLKRRLTLFSWAAHNAWLLLEADPAVKIFCERPAYVEGEAGRLIDYWVSRGRFAKFWVLAPSETETPAFPKSVHGVALRVLGRADLIAFDQRIHNWSQILPYRVSFARYPDARLQRDILKRLDKPHRLERLEAAFQPLDVTAVRAALFELLATGKITAAELDSKPLGLTTIFRRPAR